MSTRLVRKIVKEQEALMKRLGFDEKSLNSPYKEGWLTSELDVHINRAVTNMFYDRSPTDFEVRPIGVYQDDLEVRYGIHFHFDPKENNVSITKMDARCDGETISVLINGNSQIPQASELFSLLSAAMERRYARSERPRKIIPRPPGGQGMGI